jgi:hypothetical protein
MINVVLDYGEPVQDKAILRKKDAQCLIKEMQEVIKVLQKICDKGGVVVITQENTVITSYHHK